MVDIKEFESLYCDIFERNGLKEYISDQNIELFHRLTKRMLEVNAVMNLTALDTPEKIIPLHYTDCALAVDRFPEGATVADVGCGGGFPTLPLAILRPDLQITGIDSTGKKVQYVADTAKLLGLDNVKTMTARAEELGRDPAWRETFDVVTSRAVARMNLLDELCMPLCRVGGRLIFLKGAAGQAEVAEAAVGIARLGGGVPACEDMTLYTTGETEARTLVTIEKTAETPREFPRSFGQIKKRPL